MLLQATNDSVFSPTSPFTGEFNVDIVQESTNKSLGISIYGGADPVTGPSAVFIEKLWPDGLAACDGRLHAGKSYIHFRHPFGPGRRVQKSHFSCSSSC